MILSFSFKPKVELGSKFLELGVGCIDGWWPDIARLLVNAPARMVAIQANLHNRDLKRTQDLGCEQRSHLRAHQAQGEEGSILKRVRST